MNFIFFRRVHFISNTSFCRQFRWRRIFSSSRTLLPSPKTVRFPIFTKSLINFLVEKLGSLERTTSNDPVTSSKRPTLVHATSALAIEDPNETKPAWYDGVLCIFLWCDRRLLRNAARTWSDPFGVNYFCSFVFILL